MKNLRVSLAWIGYGKPLRNANKIQTPVGLGRALFGNGLQEPLSIVVMEVVHLM